MGLTDFAFISYFVLVALSTIASKAPDDCNDGSCCSNSTYIEINEPRRSIKSIWKVGQVALCDRGLRRGWYRFTSFVGGKMPENKVLPNNCGTHAPIWLKGTHPSKKGENVVRRACINAFNIDPDGCFDSFNINITKCPGDYFVYYLRPPWYCSAGYCAGYKEPCPYGTEGEPPNCYDFPKEFSSDNIENPEIIVQEGEDVSVTLLCKVNILNGIASWKNVTYKIEWFAEGNSLQVETICGGIPPGSSNDDACPNGPLVSKLSGSKYKIGNWISCNVSAMFTTSPKNVWSPSKAVREPFFAGIQVYPRTTLLQLQVQTCSLSIQTITFIPKIPARKNANGDWPMVKFWFPKEIQLVDNNQCGVQLEGTKNVSIAIKATCPDGQVTEGLKAIVPQMELHSTLWHSKTGLPTIWVTVLKPKGDNIQTCTSVTDPHITALGANRYYDFMGLGDFILYKNMERKFEVHTRQWACDGEKFPEGGHNGAGRVSCNCGAVLRDHNDVIEFSCCNKPMIRDRRTPITVKIRSKKCLSPGISIKRVMPGINGIYEVLFPSGAKVVIRRNKWGLDVVIKTPRAIDRNQEGGLCVYPGPYNIRITDTGFRERLEVGKSYFDTLPVDVRDDDVTYSLACLCQKEERNEKRNGKRNEKRNKTELLCMSVFKAAFPTLVKDNKTPVNLASPSSLCDRQKRDIHYSDDITDEDLQLYKQTLHLHPRFKRSVAIKQIPKENATRYCASRISDTELGKLCAKIGVNIQQLVDTCSADVELTGDLAFASGSVSLLVEQCGVLGAKNLSTLVNGSDEGNPAAAEAFGEQVAELLCPNDCTLNGKCINGSCVCYEEYTASDCSISIYQKPEIYRLQEDGLCDRRKRSCKKVTVFGVDFRNSTNMTCHINEFKVLNSSWKPNSTELRFPGVMTDLVLVDCYLPESQVTQGYFSETDEGTAASGLTISISNDGEHKSKENLTFISFDSACMSCNISSGCLFKGNSCLINGYCFAPNETNPLNWCYQCLPEISTSTWTKRQVNLPPEFSSTSDYFAVSRETLELAIDVADPEGMPVTLSLMQGSPTNASVVDSVLTWKATNDASTQFFLKAADACQASSYANITVSLVVCQCQNNGTCVPYPNKPRGSGFYECNCLPGFTGEKCETNIDECQSFPCFRGRCIDGVNTYECTCDPGYVGRDCDTDYDDCSSSPCVHGNCTDFVGTYRCTCDPGYSGPNCTIDVDECESSPCAFGACVDHVNKYTCVCDDGYTGYDCEDEVDECLSSPCIRGTCVDKINSFSCICPTGFSGARCDDNIDDCLANPCVNGTCIDLVNNYTCNCFAGFTGSSCDVKIENCTDDSCYPNVTCFKNSEIISCGPCPLGFTGDGKNCKDIDYCISHECKNNGSCVDGISNYTCNCLDGFAGGRCEIDTDDCVNHKCANGGSCLDGVNNYSCSCAAGFTGDRCGTDIDDCANHSCANSATCVDGTNDFSCNCIPGYTGERCETNIDDCDNHTCANGATCVDGANNFSCRCIPGYSGERCETDIYDCANHTCANGALCVDRVNNYSCSCMAGFTGDRCEADIDDCANHTCANGATCIDGTNDFSCKCIPGYTGEHCETDIDDCYNHTCANGATCLDGIKNFSCSCLPGYTGEQCETAVVKHSVQVISKYMTTSAFNSNQTRSTVLSTHLTTSSISESSAMYQIHTTSTVKDTTMSSSVIKDIPTIEAREKTNTPKSTTDDPETVITVEIRIESSWNEDLKDETSAAFKDLALVIENEIGKQYSEVNNFIGVQISAFRRGSVVVEFKLLFKEKVTDETAVAPLRKAVDNGSLGPLAVQPASLRIVKEDEDPTEDSKEKLPYPLIIGASCAGIAVLVFISIYLVHRHQRYKERNRKCSSSVMPSEVSFPNPEKYELKEAHCKEDIISYEELGVWKNADGNDKFHFSDEAVRYHEVGIHNMAADYQEMGNPNDVGYHQ